MNRQILIAGFLFLATLLLAVFPMMFLEDEFDRLMWKIQNPGASQNFHVVIVELNDGAMKWPIGRSAISHFAQLALDKGAIAVGVDVDMSTPTSDDAKLIELIGRDKRVVILATPTLNKVNGDTIFQGLEFDRLGIFQGVRCDDLSFPSGQPFSVRLVLASGIDLQQLQSSCDRGVLYPNLYLESESPPVIRVSDLHRAARVLQGRVAIFGTENLSAGLLTKRGILSSAGVNASIVESAYRNSWGKSGKIIYAMIYLGLFLFVFFVLQRVRYRGTAFLLVVIFFGAVFGGRFWFWYPLSPVVTLFLMLLFWLFFASRDGKSVLEFST